MGYKNSLSDANIQRLGDSQEVIALVNKEISESENRLSDWKNKIVTYYELYQMVQRKKHYVGLATIFVPETLRAVETIVAKLYQMIFSQSDWYEYYGRDNNGDEGPAIALTLLTGYQMEENAFKSKVMDSLRQMVIAGLTVRKIGWDYQETKRKVLAIVDGNPQPQQVVETIRDTWTFEPVDLLTFHISDINIPYNDVQKAAWIGEQYMATKQWVHERCRRGWFSKLQKDKLSDTPEATSSQASQRIDSRLQSSGFLNADKKDRVEIIERWGLVKASWVLTPEQMAEEGYDEDDMVEGVIVIANRVAILKLEVNPFWHGQKPYVVCPYVPKEFELPGIGVAQIGESLQQEINDTRNQTLDNKTLILSGMWLKSRASGIKNTDLIIRQNGVVQTNDMNGLQSLRPPVVAGIGTNMEGVAKDDLRQSVGAASNLQGIAQAGVGTATESTQINRESIGRLLQVAQMYSELVLKPTLVFAEYLNYQYYDHIKVIRIIGPVGAKWKKLAPEELAGGHKDVSIKIALDITENPAVLRQQMMNFQTIVQQLPPELLEFHWKALDKIYGMFFAGHTLDELYPNPHVEPENLLSPDEERDTILAEQGVTAKKGQDHKSYLQYHEREFEQMKWGLSEMQFELYKKLIYSHNTMLQQELMEQEVQFLQQQAMMMGMGEEGGQGGAGNRGQTQNASPFTQTKSPTSSNIRQGIGQ